MRWTWKLVDTAGTLELYDLVNDPGEHTNVLKQQPQLVLQLRAAHDELIEAEKRSPF